MFFMRLLLILLWPHLRKSGIRNPSNFGLWNPEIWNPVNEMQNPKSAIHLWNPESTAWNPGIQDSLGLPYMGRLFFFTSATSTSYVMHAVCYATTMVM